MPSKFRGVVFYSSAVKWKTRQDTCAGTQPRGFTKCPNMEAKIPNTMAMAKIGASTSYCHIEDVGPSGQLARKSRAAKSQTEALGFLGLNGARAYASEARMRSHAGAHDHCYMGRHHCNHMGHGGCCWQPLYLHLHHSLKQT